MENSLSMILKISLDQINIKSTSTDGLGMIGKGEGISVLSITTVQK